MTQLYDPRITSDYPAYFCRGVQQAANLLHRLSSRDHNGQKRNSYTLKTSDCLVRGGKAKTSQSLDIKYDFNAHTVNEMFEFLTVLNRMRVIISFGQGEIVLDRSEVNRLEKIGEGGESELIHEYIKRLGYTSHLNVNARRAGHAQYIEGASQAEGRMSSIE
jgi:hypothetical protein